MTEVMHPEAQKKADAALAKVVNSTGFPLQLAIKRKIEESHIHHGWGVASMEHPWEHPHSKTVGYADLILQSHCSSQIMIVECKRVLDSDWIFLCPSEGPGTQPKKWQVARAWVTHLEAGVHFYDWDSMNIQPVAYRSEFCGIPKMDNKATTMLEKLGAELIEATEAIARQDMRIANGKMMTRAYHPVIVTTAPLKVCKFLVRDINERGEVTKCEFEEVPFLRFHKCLGTRLGDVSKSEHFNQVLKVHERTVHVVNSAHLEAFLTEWVYAFPHTISRRFW